jgi:predicted NAD/FAD-binding protein
MRIAVIGTGISGMVAAYRLCAEHDVTVYEAGAYIGGHTHTVDVLSKGNAYAVDTGFIVHNDWTYPRFIALLEELGVPWQDSDMSFSVRCDKSGLEYNGTSINSLFAQRRNLVRPSFLRMVADILRFGARAPALLAPGAPQLSLGDYLRGEGYSRFFIEHYIVPMGAAVWSSRPADMLEFPARFLVEFFSNHGFLNVNRRPVWRVVRGGSREYVKRLTAPFASRIRLNTPVESLVRQPLKVCLRLKDGTVEHFDQVFIACHSDQALAMLGDASAAEADILGAISYQENEALLHTDIRLMPQRRLAWAAWNYHIPAQPVERVAVTYNMNILQGLQAPESFLLSLNRSDKIDPRKVLGRFVYHHPVYTAAAVAAQRRRHEINGTRRTYFCGAYWGYGFHEDGVKSAEDSLEEFARRHNHAQPNLQRVG